MTAQYDLLGLSLHPGLTLVAGQAQSGKTSFMNWLLAGWRTAGPRGGHTLALDSVCGDPPTPKYLAAWADYWCDVEPARIPAEVSLVACDEASTFLRSSQRLSPVMYDLAKRGQHMNDGAGVSAVFGSQRITDIPTDVRGQAKRWVIFRIISVPDLEWLGRNVAGIEEHHLQMLPMLPPGYCIIIEDGRVYTPHVDEWAEFAR